MSTPENSVKYRMVNEVKLPARQIWREGGDHRGQVVTCVRGIVWLTHEGMPGDHVLTAGQAFVVEQRGLLLAQGLGDAVLQIADPTFPNAAATASLN
jgi:Protein of unknown function (DUF2917)